MTVDDVLKTVSEKRIKFVDLRFTDTRGKEQHISITPQCVNESLFEDGIMFDASSIAGWQKINNSDMMLLPLPETATLDPFFDEPSLLIRCNILDPHTKKDYGRDPRCVARRAEKYLEDSGIADQCCIGPEPEFFILDNVQWKTDIDHVFFRVDSQEAAWNSSRQYDHGNKGHRPRIKGGYFPVPPVDSGQDIRSAMCLAMQEMGIIVERHHHEVATCLQNEINIHYDSLCKMADHMQTFKYVVHNIAHAYGKTATFMPKPLVGDNGSGMHCHLSLAKGGENLFNGDEYAGLSQIALYFIGGVIKHARALNAFTNPTTNSYRRLVPGFEAPVMLAYSACNRSAAIRVPYAVHPQGRRIEIRFPDPSANPYLAFSAILMAGLDGIKNKINPGDPIDKDLYELDGEEASSVPVVCGYLDEALTALREDSEFLLLGDVFTQDLIDAYIELKKEEIARLRMVTHPLEFDMYFSV